MIQGLKIDIPADELKAAILKAARNWEEIADADAEYFKSRSDPALREGFTGFALQPRDGNLRAAVESMRFVAEHLILTESGLDPNGNPAETFQAMVPIVMGFLQTSLDKKDGLLKDSKDTGKIVELRPGDADVPPKAVPKNPFGERPATYRLDATLDLVWMHDPPDGDGPFYPFGPVIGK